ncbi:hypothetical protein SLE2022_010400 [Rubroshorea leprosula]
MGGEEAHENGLLRNKGCDRAVFGLKLKVGDEDDNFKTGKESRRGSLFNICDVNWNLDGSVKRGPVSKGMEKSLGRGGGGGVSPRAWRSRWGWELSF